MATRVQIVAGLALSTLLTTTISDAATRNDSLDNTGVTLYELSERVTFDPDLSAAAVIWRNAVAPGLRKARHAIVHPSF